MKNMLSPVTTKTNCVVEETFDSDTIVQLYSRQYSLEVARFFKNIPNVELRKCVETGYRFYHPVSIMGDGLFYEQLQKGGEKNGNGYYRSNTFDHKISYAAIKDGDKVLEIGCGDGSFMKMVKSSKSVEMTGLELNNYAVEKCKEEGLSVHNILIEEFSEKHKKQFDKVCSFQVLEHVYDVNSFIASSLKALKPNGQLIISVPNSSPYLMRHDRYATLNLPPHHVGLWNKSVFENLCKIFPIQLLDVQYSQQLSTKGDAYFRTKKWLNIKAKHDEHSLGEKIKMGLLLPFSYCFSLKDKLMGKINGNQICVVFQKK